MARRLERGVRQLAVRARCSQKESAARHVAESRESGRETEPVAKNRPQDVDVLSGCYAAKQNHQRVVVEFLSERTRIALERLAIVALPGIDGCALENFHTLLRDAPRRRHETVSRRDHKSVLDAAEVQRV